MKKYISQIKRVFTMPTYSALLFISLLSLTTPAQANFGNLTAALAVINTTCPSAAEQYSQLQDLKTAISAAETVEQARTLALAPTDSAIDALDNANALLPNDAELNAAKLSLDQARAKIRAAATQQQVAAEFSGLLLAGLDSPAANVGVGKAECHYTTGETIAIVIGLILGIIPGLILLVLLC
jgi:ABC-type multidrug transport system fused ATPase/permease subunit